MAGWLAVAAPPVAEFAGADAHVYLSAPDRFLIGGVVVNRLARS